MGVLQAAEEPKGSAERLMYVTAFTLASWSEARSHQMHFKPTKPLARETYELVMPKEGYKFLAEDVGLHTLSSHPYLVQQTFMKSDYCLMSHTSIPVPQTNDLVCFAAMLSHG